jgi:V/A-type H+/Na+-transporting ATPase subunit K
MLIDPAALAIAGGAIALAGGIGGSAIGIGMAASAGAATLGEDPKQLRNVILLSSLPMTQTFYALILLIIVITTVVPQLGPDNPNGFAVLAIGLIVAVAEFFSAWFQGNVCASTISLLAKTKGKILTNGIMLAVLVELFGLLGMVFAIMTMTLINIM